jgi:hypothetical protein
MGITYHLKPYILATLLHTQFLLWSLDLFITSFVDLFTIYIYYETRMEKEYVKV